MEGRTARRLASAVLLLALGFLLFRALTGRLIYWDGFVYLVDARSIGGGVRGYWYLHAPLTPMLHIPGVMLADAGPAAGPLCWIGPQLNALLITVGLLVALFLWARRCLGTGWSLLAVVLFVGGRAFVHYGATPMADMPSALFATLALMAYPATSASLGGGAWRPAGRWALFGLWIGAALLAKFPMVILPVPFVLAELLGSLRERRVDWRRWSGLAFSGLVAAAVFLGVLAWAQSRVFGGVVFGQVAQGLREATGITFGEAAGDYLRMLPIMVSPVTLGLAAVGALVAWRRCWPEHAATVLWVVFCVAFFSLEIVHNEFRYLIPMLPAMALLAALGAKSLHGAAWAWASERGRHRLVGGVGLLLVTATLLPALRQGRRDLHPFFSAATQPELGRFLSAYSPEGGVVYSEARAIQMAPPIAPLMESDEFYDVFDVGEPFVEYVARRGWEPVPPQRSAAVFLDRQDGPAGVLIRPAREWRSGMGAGRKPTFHTVVGRRVWALTVDRDHYVDADGEPRLRFSVEGDSLQLTAVGLEGELEIRVPGQAPGGRRRVQRGQTLELALGGVEPPSALIVVQRVQRRFPGVWSGANP